jgi:hypothetical protein
MISLAGIICDLNSISKLMLHAFVNSHLASNFKFTTTIDSTLSNIFKTNHDKKKNVYFETTRLSVVSYVLHNPKKLNIGE